MTGEDRKQLEPVLAPLRSRIKETDFMELTTMYIQRVKDYVICGIKENRADRVCLECFDMYYRANGLVIISAEERRLDLSSLLKEHGEYHWWDYYRYHDKEDIDNLLLWMQRRYSGMPYKYREIGKTLNDNLPGRFERRYGWWEKEDEEE